MQCIRKALHNVYQTITLYTLNVIMSSINQISIKLEQQQQQNTPELVSLQFGYKTGKLLWKVFESTIPHFHQQSKKLRSCEGKRKRNSDLPCGHISFSCPVWSKNFLFQMHSCETMFTNKYWKGSKPKYEHCTKRQFYYFNHYLATALNTYGKREKHYFNKMFKALKQRKITFNTVV